MKIKQKTCRECKQKYTPMRAISPVCDSFDCKVAYANKAAEKSATARKSKELRQHKERKQQLKNKSDWLRETQTVFNAFIRLRDAHLPCISCGNHLSNQYCAGHYRTVGSAPHLRFDERNVHKQCNRYCNMELSGNIIKYRQGLVAKIGLEAVERLESDNSPKHYTIDEIKQIKIDYKNKIKLLKGV